MSAYPGAHEDGSRCGAGACGNGSSIFRLPHVVMVVLTHVAMVVLAHVATAVAAAVAGAPVAMAALKEAVATLETEVAPPMDEADKPGAEGRTLCLESTLPPLRPPLVDHQRPIRKGLWPPPLPPRPPLPLPPLGITDIHDCIHPPDLWRNGLKHNYTMRGTYHAPLS